MKQEEITKKKLLKEADSRIIDAMKVFASAKTSLDESKTTLVMNLSYHFHELYATELTQINAEIATAVESINNLAMKIRKQLKQ